jgi:uncharacterized SAM-binding protein YcdF (DUF218 family)
MFQLKQVIGTLLMPLPFATLLAIAGVTCHLFRHRRAALTLYISGALVAYLSATALGANFLILPLERAYPSLGDHRPPGVVAIVVLGSSYAPRNGVPVTAALEEDAVVRLVEGVRLKSQFEDLRLVLSGGAPKGQAIPAEGYFLLARELKVPVNSMVMLSDSLDTGDEARNVVGLLHESPFLLVTSAYHMPRAMRLMRRAGAQPIAAPTGHLVADGRLGWGSFIPSALVLRRTERALHEYMGLAALTVGVD